MSRETNKSPKYWEGQVNRSGPESTRAMGGVWCLLEGSSVVVDRFPVPTLILQEIGVVAVNLRIVGQSLDSRPNLNKLRKKTKKSNKEYCLGMSDSFTFY